MRTPNAEPPRADALGARLDAAVTRAKAVEALRGLSWSQAVARVAVDAALAALGTDAPLERVIVEALRRCPKPGG